MIFESLSIPFTNNIHLKCNLKATEFSNLITQLCIRQLFSDLHSSFFFLKELSEWIPLGVKGQIRNLFRDFFSFDDAILEIIGFEAELHHQKIVFPKITSDCNDTNHFDTIMKAIGNLTEIEKWLKNVWISSLLKLSFYLVFLVRNFIFKILYRWATGKINFF